MRVGAFNNNTRCVNGKQENSLDWVGFNKFILDYIEFQVHEGIKNSMSSGQLNKKSKIFKKIKLGNILVLGCIRHD